MLRAIPAEMKVVRSLVCTSVLLAACSWFDSTESAPAKKPDKISEELARAKDVGVAMERAIAAAKEAELAGSNDCEKAYLGLVRTAQVLKDESIEQMANPPNEAQFLDACDSLPVIAQRCLVMSHAVDNVEACRTVTKNLDPDSRARIEAAMVTGHGS